MTYGQQPDPNRPDVPPVPPAPGYTTPAPPAPGGAAQPPYAGAPAQQPYGTTSPPSYGQYGAPAQAGAPWAATTGPMKRPGTVTAGSVLAFIGGGFMVIIGLLLAALGGSDEFADAIADSYGPIGSAIVGVGIVFILIGALVIFFGVMAFKGRRWGAIGLAVLAGLSVIGAISDLASGNGGSIVGLAWSVTGAILLLVSSSQAWYRSNQR